MKKDHENYDKLTMIFTKWLGFILILAVLLYAIITSILNSEDFLYVITLILMIFFGFALFLIIKKQLLKPQQFGDLKDYGGIFVFVATVITFLLALWFSAPVVIASALVGLIGHLFIKKYEVAIYCGSFAGMTSVNVFNIQEIFLLAFLAGLVFFLTKPIFKGFGGKLGTVAFVSSVLSFTILNKLPLIDSYDYQFLWIVLVSVLGVMSTYSLQHYFKQSAVFASSITSLVFAVIMVIFLPAYYNYAGVFFTASFVGMSSNFVMKNYYFAFFSSLVLGFIFHQFIPIFNGFGGKMGTMALLSVIMTYGFSNMLLRISHKKKNMV